MDMGGWMIILFLVLSLAVFAAALLFTVIGVSIVCQKARRKGYRPPGIVLIIIGALLIASGLAISLVFLRPPNQWWMFLTVPVVLVCGLVGTAALLTWLLPRRKNRVFGPRSPSYFPQVIALLSLVCVLPVFAVLLWKAWQTADYLNVIRLALGAFVSVCVLASIPAAYRQYVLSSETLDEALAKDPRPPIVYLRPFAQERSVFVMGSKHKYQQYKNTLGAMPRTGLTSITFEDYVSAPIKELIGPFLALGSPEDYSSPIGAARKYAKDEDWQDEFERLARGAAGIILEVTRSANLKWELEYIRLQGLHERLFVITRHFTMFRPPGQRRWLEDSFLWAHLRMGGINLYPTSWQEFAHELAILGYRMDLDDPGPGAVVTFDAEGCGVLLVSNADVPQDFIQPIYARIARIS